MREHKKTEEDKATKNSEHSFKRYFALGKKLSTDREIGKANLRNRTLLISLAVGCLLVPGVGAPVLLASLLPSLFGAFLFEELKGSPEKHTEKQIVKEDFSKLLKEIRQKMSSKDDKEIMEMYKKIVTEQLDEELENKVKEAIKEILQDDSFIGTLAKEVKPEDLETHLAAITVEMGDITEKLQKEIDRLQKIIGELENKLEKIERNWVPSTEKSHIRLITAGEEEFDDKNPARPEFCYGREEEVKKFREFLERIREGEETKRGFLIRGASGTGKSSLSLKLKDELKDLPFIVIDSRGYNGQDFFLKVLGRFQEEISGSAWDMDPDIDPIPQDAQTFEEFIHSILHGLKRVADTLQQKGKIGLIYLDQFETLTQFRGAMDTASMILLKTSQLRYPLIIAMGARNDLFSFPEEYWGRIYENSENLFLEEINSDAVNDILRDLKKKSNGLDEEDKNRMINFVTIQSDRDGGKSWLMKKLCRFILENGLNNFRAITDEELFIRIFKMDIEDLEDDEMAMLRNLARASMHAPADIKKIANFEMGKSSEEDIARDRKILEKLEEKRLVMKIGEKYAIYHDKLKEYIIKYELGDEERVRIQAEAYMDFLLGNSSQGIQGLIKEGRYQETDTVVNFIVEITKEYPLIRKEALKKIVDAFLNEARRRIRENDGMNAYKSIIKAVRNLSWIEDKEFFKEKAEEILGMSGKMWAIDSEKTSEILNKIIDVYDSENSHEGMKNVAYILLKNGDEMLKQENYDALLVIYYYITFDYLYMRFFVDELYAKINEWTERTEKIANEVLKEIFNSVGKLLEKNEVDYSIRLYSYIGRLLPHIEHIDEDVAKSGQNISKKLFDAAEKLLETGEHKNVKNSFIAYGTAEWLYKKLGDMKKRKNCVDRMFYVADRLFALGKPNEGVHIYKKTIEYFGDEEKIEWAEKIFGVAESLSMRLLEGESGFQYYILKIYESVKSAYKEVEKDEKIKSSAEKIFIVADILLQSYQYETGIKVYKIAAHIYMGPMDREKLKNCADKIFEIAEKLAEAKDNWMHQYAARLIYSNLAKAYKEFEDDEGIKNCADGIFGVAKKSFEAKRFSDAANDYGNAALLYRELKHKERMKECAQGILESAEALLEAEMYHDLFARYLNAAWIYEELRDEEKVKGAQKILSAAEKLLLAGEYHAAQELCSRAAEIYVELKEGEKLKGAENILGVAESLIEAKKYADAAAVYLAAANIYKNLETEEKGRGAEKIFYAAEKLVEYKEYYYAGRLYEDIAIIYTELGDSQRLEMCADRIFYTAEKSSELKKYRSATNLYESASKIYEELRNEEKIRNCDENIFYATKKSVAAKDDYDIYNKTYEIYEKLGNKEQLDFYVKKILEDAEDLVKAKKYYKAEKVFKVGLDIYKKHSRDERMESCIERIFEAAEKIPDSKYNTGLYQFIVKTTEKAEGKEKMDKCAEKIFETADDLFGAEKYLYAVELYETAACTYKDLGAVSKIKNCSRKILESAELLGMKLKGITKDYYGSYGRELDEPYDIKNAYQIAAKVSKELDCESKAENANSIVWGADNLLEAKQYYIAKDVYLIAAELYKEVGNEEKFARCTTKVEDIGKVQTQIGKYDTQIYEDLAEEYLRGEKKDSAIYSYVTVGDLKFAHSGEFKDALENYIKALSVSMFGCKAVKKNEENI